MGDLVGEQLDGTLHYVGREGFSALRALGLTPEDEVASFADLCRINALYMIARAGSGHIGSSFSSLDIVSHVLLRLIPNAAARGESPGFYFSSKGHDVPGLYAAMIGLGQLPEEYVHRLRQVHGLPGHPDVITPGIVTNTGSLGMGISKAKGMVRAHRARGERRRIVVLTGDGELQEGQIWESLAGAVHSAMEELTVIVDHNKLQSDTFVRATSDLGDLEAKFAAFGFYVLRTDGHDPVGLAAATDRALAVEGGPQVIIADTIKGAGVSFMEHTALQGPAPLYRYHSGAPDRSSYQQALRELGARVQKRLAGRGELPPLRAVHVPEQLRSAAATSMVQAYGEALLAAGRQYETLMVLDADLCVDMGLSPFREAFPERYVECGIAEMDMVSQAGGAALQGLLPICHSFACFMTPRANEQIYNNASEQTKVVYVGGLAGLLPAGPGHSHQGLRDIAALSAIPGLTCLAPTDASEVPLALSFALQTPGPVYIRLCALAVDPPYGPTSAAELVAGRGRCLKEGQDGVVIAYGPVMTSQAYVAAQRLAEQGKAQVAVVALPFLNSVDEDWLQQVVAGKGFVLLLDDHYREGGQGQMLAAILAELRVQAPVSRLGVRGWPACGAPEDVLRVHGLHADDLVVHIEGLLDDGML